jgi:hypothetical protein
MYVCTGLTEGTRKSTFLYRIRVPIPNALEGSESGEWKAGQDPRGPG